MFKIMFSPSGIRLGHRHHAGSFKEGVLYALPPGHHEETRAKIRSARKLFNRLGFDRVSIDAIMADAGLTRGAFYSYFNTKSDLYAEVLECFFTDPGWNNSWKGVHIDLFKAMVRTLERGLQSADHPRHTAAQAIAAMCVGSMVTARAMGDHPFTDRLRKASMAVALKLGGWEKARIPNRRTERRTGGHSALFQTF